MNLVRIGAAVSAIALLLSACSKRETAVTPPPSSPPLPTAAQPPLPTLKLYVGAEELTAEVARRRMEVMTGMMFRTNVVDGDAMLFVLPQPQQAAFWMKNCPEPLSCAYISPDGIIEEIHAMEPYNTNPIVANARDIVFVLETPAGWFDRHNVRTGMLVQTERGSLLDTFFRRTGSR